MVNILVFRWPKPLFFMVLGAHGTHWKFDEWINYISKWLGPWITAEREMGTCSVVKERIHHNDSRKEHRLRHGQM